ncbi:hypothetical protein G7Y89_g13478 [Cudoniella acicularis]|uniref:Nuclear pore protein n=1 Tax=Cudoniella acicularis TaxID=354080 RepID=A0A8H4R6U4_9HELO|nr:hypothetical protein G7Y89_g13478 [Cudoniella acicularis]
MEWDAQRKRIYEYFGIWPKETPTAAAIAGRKGSFAPSASEERGSFGRSRRSEAATLAGSRAGGSVNGGSVFGRASLNRSVIGTASSVGSVNQPVFADVEKKMEENNILLAGPHDRQQREKQSKYTVKVQDLNLARIQRRPYAICKEFTSVVTESPDTHGPDLIKAYRTLTEIVGEDSAIKNLADPRWPRERQFATVYLESADSAAATSLKRSILRGGARCLEKGIPNVINKVKAYVQLQAARKNLACDNNDLLMLGDDYVWALIYSLLRTGHVAEANYSYINAYATSEDRRLLRIFKHESMPSTTSVFASHLKIRSTLTEWLATRLLVDEDFAWVQLVLAREINRVEAMANEVYGLKEAQDTIREIGTRFFSTKGGAEIGSSFGAYVFLQVAFGMFEDAVSYLYGYNYIDGVHLAIALDFYGLLRVTDPQSGVEDLLSLTTRAQPQINFGPMLGLYTRDFRAANVTAAVDYTTLTYLNKDLPGAAGQNQVKVCHEGLRQLVLESREFVDLLGDMQVDGRRIRGSIEQRMKLIGLDDDEEFFRSITLQAASQADDNGRVTDAVLLYHLAGEYDSVIAAINRALSTAVSTPVGEQVEKLEPLKPRATTNGQEPGSSFSLTSIDDPVELASAITHVYKSSRMFMDKIKHENSQACGNLLGM